MESLDRRAAAHGLALALGTGLVVLTAGCPRESIDRTRDAGPAGFDAWVPVDPNCDPSMDADGDGIADWVEGRQSSRDTDGDGTPDYQDADADGDGITDSDEAASGNPCAPLNSDMDGLPNFIDTDADNDGLTDAEEREIGTSPITVDTDSDGVSDLGEVRGTMTSPTDPTDTIPEGDFFVVLPYLGEHVPRELDFGTDISVADIYFLVDTTGSMGEPIANVQRSLTRIASDLSTEIASVQMGVGEHRDFPFCESMFSITGCYGSAGDQPYVHHQNITSDVAAVQAGLGRLSAGGGADGPESQTGARFPTGSGPGGEWTFFNGTRWSIEPARCEILPDETFRRIGYPCFRRGALPIIVLVSDVEFHNGPANANPYERVTPAPHSLDRAVSEMTRIGARFIGVAVDGGGRAHQEAVARATGSVDGSGDPLVYDAAGGTVSDAIIEGIRTLVGGTPQDVDTRTENVPGNPGDVDATGFIKLIVPQTGCNPGSGVCGPSPGVTYERQDETTFYGVIPGTRVTFDVDFYNDFVPTPPTAQIYRARIIVVGNGVADLDEREVYIVVPPEGGVVLI